MPDGAEFRASIDGFDGGAVALDQYAQVDSLYLGRYWTVMSDQYPRTLDANSAEVRGKLQSVVLNTREKLYLGDVNYVPAYLVDSALRISGAARGFGVIIGDTTLTSSGTLTVDGFYTREPAFWSRPTKPFTNLGHLVAAGTSSFTTMPFINGRDASVTARGVQWEMANGVTGGGRFFADSTGALLFRGPLSFDPDAVLSADGTLTFHGATGSIPQSGVRARSLAISQGNLNCTGDLAATNLLKLGFDQSAVTKLIGGRLILDSGGIGLVNVRPYAPDAPGRVVLNGTEVVNHGSISLTGECLTHSGGTGTLTNLGAVRTDGYSLLQWNIYNGGTFAVGSGTLTLTGSVVGPGSFHLHKDASLAVGTADPNHPIRVFDGMRTTFDGTLSVGSNVTIHGDVRTPYPITTRGPGVTFLGNVHAPSIDISVLTRFAGAVEAQNVVGYAVFDGPVAIDTVRGTHVFNAAENRVGSMEVYRTCTVNGALDVENAVRLYGDGWSFGGTGTTRLNGGVIGPEISMAGSGTLIINGPIVLTTHNGPASVGLISIYRGTLELKSDIVTTLSNPRFYIQGADSRLNLDTSLHLNVAAFRGGVVRLAPDGQHVFRYAPWDTLPRLEGTIDVNDNMLVIDYAAGATSPALDYQLGAISGYAGGAWDGAGVRSGSAAAAPGTGVAVVEARDIFSSFPAHVGGELVDATTVLVRYTLLGDANLDRLVNIEDFGLMARWFNVPGFRSWAHGDFNYDLGVTTDDFAVLAANFNQGIGLPTQRPQTVPEPIVAAGLAMAAVRLMLSRRSRTASS